MKEKTTTQTIAYTEPKPRKGQDNRSGDNFSTEGLKGDYLKWHCPPEICFRVMEDKIGHDPEIFAVITNQSVTPMRHGSKYYIANPRNTSAFSGKIPVTIEGIEASEAKTQPRFDVVCNNTPLQEGYIEASGIQASEIFSNPGPKTYYYTLRCDPSVSFDLIQFCPDCYLYHGLTNDSSVCLLGGVQCALANPRGATQPFPVHFEICNDLTSIPTDEWMTGVYSNKLLTAMSIPGTHDSGSYNFHPGPWRCQNFSIGRQLNDGIRFFDIRLGKREDGDYPGNNLVLYHGGSECGVKFSTVMKCCRSFLKRHPGEAILMSVKHEHGEEELSDYFAEYLRDYPTLYYKGNTIPKLVEARGKIVFFYRFDFKPDTQKFPTVSPSAAGIRFPEWPDNTIFDKTNLENQRFRIVDEYDLHDTNKKTENIKELLHIACMQPKIIVTCFIIFNSIGFGFGNHTPYQYAWGGYGVKPAMNPWLLHYLRASKEFSRPREPWRFGIILLDFYNNKGKDMDLVKEIISINY